MHCSAVRCRMQQISHRHWIPSARESVEATLPSCPSCLLAHPYMLIRLNRGETKVQIVACMHAPFSSPFCRQRFVSFGVGLPICGRIRARAAPGWDRCMWEGWGQNWVGQGLKYTFEKETQFVVDKWSFLMTLLRCEAESRIIGYFSSVYR